MSKLKCVCVCVYYSACAYGYVCVCICAHTQMLAVVIMGLPSWASLAVFETHSSTESEDHGLVASALCG